MPGSAAARRSNPVISARAPFTHKGWFWLCPIYLAPEMPACPVDARHELLQPIFSLCEYFEAARIWLTTLVNPNYAPMFMFCVTGELKR